jgi:putative transposase
VRFVVRGLPAELSFRDSEQMMIERGVFVDDFTLRRWAREIRPLLAAMFRQPKRPVGRSFRMDETYIQVGSR